MFLAKGQMADILGSVCNKVSIATAQICHHCMKAVTDNIKINQHPCANKTFFTKPNGELYEAKSMRARD